MMGEQEEAFIRVRFRLTEKARLQPPRCGEVYQVAQPRAGPQSPGGRAHRVDLRQDPTHQQGGTKRGVQDVYTRGHRSQTSRVQEDQGSQVGTQGPLGVHYPPGWRRTRCHSVRLGKVPGKWSSGQSGAVSSPSDCVFRFRFMVRGTRQLTTSTSTAVARSLKEEDRTAAPQMHTEKASPPAPFPRSPRTKLQSHSLQRRHSPPVISEKVLQGERKGLRGKTSVTGIGRYIPILQMKKLRQSRSPVSDRGRMQTDTDIQPSLLNHSPSAPKT